jgi:hypothetical protein
LEIGGKIVVRTFRVPSVALALGLSINDTVSILLVGLSWVFSAAERRASARPAGAVFSFTVAAAPGAGFSTGLAFDSLTLAGAAF